MKNIINFIFVTIGIAIFSVSCSKAVNEEQEILPQYSISETSSWEVGSSNLVEELLAGMELAEGISVDELARTQLQISHAKNGQYTFTHILSSETQTKEK